MKTPRKLDINFDSLFPGKAVVIAGVSIEIKPLCLEEIASATRKLRALGSLFLEAGISWENYNTPKSVFGIAEIILTSAPSILEEVTGISVEDLKRLPIDVIVELLTTVIEVNTASKDSLEKNFLSLAGHLKTPLQEK